MATCFSPKLVLGAGVVFWSLFTIATPFTAGNLPMLLATRAAMGVGEGVTFPAIQNLFAKCAPLAPGPSLVLHLTARRSSGASRSVRCLATLPYARGG